MTTPYRVVPQCDGFGPACKSAGFACIGCDRGGAIGANLTKRERKAVREALGSRNDEIKSLRREIKRLRAWIRRWPNRFLHDVKTFRAVKAMQPDTFADEIRDCLAGRKVPRE